ncbi:contact-dependent growth inhibition system immunity protein [Streptomyces lavendulocolor]|uniref:contact-dependent growth inhibition system immunity protein n=1 Tax=Streptomyces lavendulocolor TaxID=67316 RepID=UPI003C2BEE36
MKKHVDRTRSLEELEGHRWPEPPADATGLVQAVHTLRRRAVGSLTPTELGRLVGQNVGLPWTLPLAIDLLEQSASEQARGGFYDDDLLTAVLTRGPAIWRAEPELAQQVKKILGELRGLSPYVQEKVTEFDRSWP